MGQIVYAVGVARCGTAAARLADRGRVSGRGLRVRHMRTQRGLNIARVDEQSQRCQRKVPKGKAHKIVPLPE